MLDKTASIQGSSFKFELIWVGSIVVAKNVTWKIILLFVNLVIIDHNNIEFKESVLFSLFYKNQQSEPNNNTN